MCGDSVISVSASFTKRPPATELDRTIGSELKTLPELLGLFPFEGVK